MRAPTHDETMRLLALIIDTMTWQQFKPILNDPEKLKAWLQANHQPESDQEYKPDQEVVAEQSSLSASQESKAWELWKELDPAEREMLTAAWVDLWGKGSKVTLPASLD